MSLCINWTRTKLQGDAPLDEPEEIMSADRMETRDRKRRRTPADDSLEDGVRQNLLIALGVAVSMLLVVVAGSLLTS
jgi:hypothetical protein